jgi:hypothetical protein
LEVLNGTTTGMGLGTNGRPVMRSPGRPGVNQLDSKRAFWKCIAQGMETEAAALACNVSQPLGPRWFREAGGMAPIDLAPHSGRYLSFRSAKRSRYCGRRIAVFVRFREGWNGRRQRFHASYAVTQRPAVVLWCIGQRLPNGKLNARPSVRRLRNWRENDQLRTYVQDRLAGTVTDFRGKPIPGPNVPWKGRRQGRRADRRWGTCWSPEQISRRIQIDYPDDRSMRISHEAIYQALYIQGRGALRRELTACLRSGRALRVPRARTQQRGKHFVTRRL